jgi:outer membrane lipoprotein-sorting protein
LTRKSWFAALVGLSAVACASHLWAQQIAGPASTDSVLAMMDKSASDFKSLTADLENTKYTDVVKDSSTETGHIFVRKDQKMRIEIVKPDPRTILRAGDSLFVYTPKIDVKLTGEEQLDGRKTFLLELTPKSDDIRRQITRIQMWIDESSWLPIQQKFFETGGGDYIQFHYSNMIKNLKISDSRFKQDWPKDANRIKPRG